VLALVAPPTRYGSRTRIVVPSLKMENASQASLPSVGNPRKMLRDVLDAAPAMTLAEFGFRPGHFSAPNLLPPSGLCCARVAYTCLPSPPGSAMIPHVRFQGGHHAILLPVGLRDVVSARSAGPGGRSTRSWHCPARDRRARPRDGCDAGRRQPMARRRSAGVLARDGPRDSPAPIRGTGRGPVEGPLPGRSRRRFCREDDAGRRWAVSGRSDSRLGGVRTSASAK